MLAAVSGPRPVNLCLALAADVRRTAPGVSLRAQADPAMLNLVQHSLVSSRSTYVALWTLLEKLDEQRGTGGNGVSYFDLKKSQPI